MKLDDLIVQYVGQFGKHQRIQFFLVILPTLFCSLNALSWTFIAPQINYRCRLSTDIGDYPIYDIGPNALLNGCNESNTTKCIYEACTLKDGEPCPNGYVFSDYSRFTALLKVILRFNKEKCFYEA